MLLHEAAVVTGRRRPRRRRQRQSQVLVLVLPLLHGRVVGKHEGVGGAGADAERCQAAQVAGRPRQPHLGPLRGRDRAAVQLGLREPWRDLNRGHGVHVRHEGRVLDSGWRRGRSKISAGGV